MSHNDPNPTPADIRSCRLLRLRDTLKYNNFLHDLYNRHREYRNLAREAALGGGTTTPAPLTPAPPAPSPEAAESGKKREGKDGGGGGEAGQEVVGERVVRGGGGME